MTDREEYIERGAVYEIIETEGKRIGMTVCNRLNCKELLRRVPAADVVEVVRCRDCKKRYVPAYCALWYGQINDEHGCRDIFLCAYNDDFYCAYGERKDETNDT